jgi:hypothetical protein
LIVVGGEHSEGGPFARQLGVDGHSSGGVPTPNFGTSVIGSVESYKVHIAAGTVSFERALYNLVNGVRGGTTVDLKCSTNLYLSTPRYESCSSVLSYLKPIGAGKKEPITGLHVVSVRLKITITVPLERYDC